MNLSCLCSSCYYFSTKTLELPGLQNTKDWQQGPCNFIRYPERKTEERKKEEKKIEGK